MTERPRIKVLRRVSENGKSRVEVVCCGCGTCQMVYVWSAAGRGKKCVGCRAKLNLEGL